MPQALGVARLLRPLPLEIEGLNLTGPELLADFSSVNKNTLESILFGGALTRKKLALGI